MEQADAEVLRAFLDRVAPMLVEYVSQHYESDRAVCDAKPPKDLERLLALDWPVEGQGIDGAIQTIADALKYSVRTGHPRFMDKLYTGSDPVGMVAELVTAALNTNLHVYSVAPVFTLMELGTVRELGKVFYQSSSTVDGVSCPGGSYSNLLALVTARSTLFPQSRSLGHPGNLVLFASNDAHYSVSKNAILSGIGIDNVIKVPTTVDGRIIVAELRECIAAQVQLGKVPFFINATAGTTVTGAFDDFAAIADVAEEFKCWMHVDACWGGAVAFSTKHRHLVAGVARADSIAWNAHKMMGVPIQSSILLTKKSGLLQKCNALGAGYLFHDENEYDLGDKTMQCGRRPDILKLYMSWQYHGLRGFENRVDKAFEAREKFVRLLIERKDKFRLVLEPVFVNVCFWYWPSTLPKTEIDHLTKRIHVQMVARGRALVDFSPATQPQEPSFFRIIIQSPHVTDDDLLFVLDEISELGQSILSAQ